MSGLKIAPAVHNPSGQNPNSTLLISDASQPRPQATDSQGESHTETPRQTMPSHATPPLGTYAPIQAQILGNIGQRSFRRPTVNSPREAARAYGQARRRPQTMSDLPRLKTVI